MIDIGKIEKLMALMSDYGMDVVQAEAGEEKISLAKNAGQLGFFPSMAMQQGGMQAQVGQQGFSGMRSSGAQASGVDPLGMESSGVQGAKPGNAASADLKEQAKMPEGTLITSPFVGTFYRSPSPESPSFVESGSRVRKGQALCIVEAMKLMNEIESEVEGEVVGILVENGKPVEFGTPLFVIKPSV